MLTALIIEKQMFVAAVDSRFLNSSCSYIDQGRCVCLFAYLFISKIPQKQLEWFPINFMEGWGVGSGENLLNDFNIVIYIFPDWKLLQLDWI